MKKKIIWLLCAAAALVVLILAGWLLMPTETEPEPLRVQDEENAELHHLTYVKRGDLERRASISCHFRALQQERLRFQYDGRLISEIEVEVGDPVEPGQVLAELENKELDELLKAAEEEADRLKKELEFARSNLEIVRYSADYYDQTDDYKKAVTRLEEDSRLADQRLQELREQKQTEVLSAGIEGTVTYVHSYEISNSATDTIVIAGKGDACFYADTEYYELLKAGDEVTLTSSEGQIRAVVTEAARLGFEESETTAKGERRVYFVPNSDADLMNGAEKATLSLLLDSRQDVLIVPERAVLFAAGEPYVFYEDENGVQTAKKVELGARFGDKYEVLSGLTEGEALIIN